VGWLGPPTIEVVVLDVVDMLVRDTVLVVKVVEAAPPDTGGLISMVKFLVVEEFFKVVTLVGDVLLLVLEVEAESPSDTGWLSTVESVFVVDEFVGGFMSMGDKVLLVLEVEVETSEILDAGWLVAMVKLLVDGEFFEDIMLLLVVVEEVEGDSSEPSDASWLVSTIESAVDAAIFVAVIV